MENKEEEFLTTRTANKEAIKGETTCFFPLYTIFAFVVDF
jgi:hypothetical protein